MFQNLNSLRVCQCLFIISTLVVFFSLIQAYWISIIAASPSKFACLQQSEMECISYQNLWPRGKGSLTWPKAPPGDSGFHSYQHSHCQRNITGPREQPHQSAAHTQGQCHPSDERTKTDIQSEETSAKVHVPGSRWHYRWRNFRKLPAFSQYMSLAIMSMA